MHIHQQIYEFAASAGAFEGYVYRKKKFDMDVAALSNWADNLLNAYHHLPATVVAEFQSACNQTLGRAIKSLIPVLGEAHCRKARMIFKSRSGFRNEYRRIQKKLPRKHEIRKTRNF